MKAWIMIAAVFGFTGVLFGAFGAHALKSRLAADALVSWETGVRYQLIHALLILFLALLMSSHASSLLRFSCYAVTSGVILFSGSIYLLATRELTGLVSWKWLGPVTPVGGLLLLTGWLLLFVWAVRSAR